MANYCNDCKFVFTDYVYDEEIEDEYETIVSCDKKSEFLSEWGEETNCPYFKKYKPKRYKREISSSLCGGCEFLNRCDNVLDVTSCDDCCISFAKGNGYCQKDSDNDEEFEYMGMPYFASDGTLYNVCDCGSYKLLTKPVVENGYRCEKCGKNWKTKSISSDKKQR